MSKLIDLTGQKFGRLTVIRRAEKPKHVKCNDTYWECECDCGNLEHIFVQGGLLKNGNTKSCGCLRKEILKNNNSKHNIYEFYNDYVIGYDVNHQKPFYFDLDDYEKIKDITWTSNNKNYIVSTKKYGNLLLSRFIMGCKKKDGLIVDHINGDIRNNRKNNLRITNKSINSLNQNPKGTGILQTLGVRKRKNRYEARLVFQGQEKYIGSYKTLEEAKRGRIEYEQYLSNMIGEPVNARR